MRLPGPTGPQFIGAVKSVVGSSGEQHRDSLGESPKPLAGGRNASMRTRPCNVNFPQRPPRATQAQFGETRYRRRSLMARC